MTGDGVGCDVQQGIGKRDEERERECADREGGGKCRRLEGGRCRVEAAVRSVLAGLSGHGRPDLTSRDGISSSMWSRMHAPREITHDLDSDGELDANARERQRRDRKARRRGSREDAPP